MRAGPGRARRSLTVTGKSTREVMLSAIQTTSKETTLQEHAAAEHGSAHDIPAESPKFRHTHKVMLGMLSETSMNIALPDLVDEFSVSSGTAQWMVVGYMLAMAWRCHASASCSNGSRPRRWSWRRQLTVSCAPPRPSECSVQRMDAAHSRNPSSERRAAVRRGIRPGAWASA